MRILREQPISCLFLVATVCVDLVLGAMKGEDELAIVAMLFGQCFVLGGWLALGEMHRLARGGLFVVGGLALAWIATVIFYEAPHFSFQQAWAQSIGAVAILAGAAALLTWVWTALLNWLLPARSQLGDSPRWQFPITELFGWTIVVAVASAAMRLASFSDAGSTSEMVTTCIFALIAALLMALFVPAHRRTSVPSVLAAVAAVIAMFALMPSIEPQFDLEIASMVAGSYVYVVLWIIVCRLDRQIARRKSVPLTEEQ